MRKVIFNKGYSVSSDGDIFNPSGKRLKTYVNAGGYEMIRIACIGDKQKSVRVHRIVATAFIPNPNNKPQVNHKDGDKLNNKVSNLEWCTGKENIQHSVKMNPQVWKKKGNTGNFRSFPGERHASAKLNNEAIDCIRKLSELGISKMVISKAFNISRTQVTRIINNKAWKNLSCLT